MDGCGGDSGGDGGDGGDMGSDAGSHSSHHHDGSGHDTHHGHHDSNHGRSDDSILTSFSSMWGAATGPDTSMQRGSLQNRRTRAAKLLYVLTGTVIIVGVAILVLIGIVLAVSALRTSAS